MLEKYKTNVKKETVKNLVNSDYYKEIFKDTYDCTEVEIDKMRHFNFLPHQIVMLGLKDKSGDIRYSYPVVVTKVHGADENGHNTYDYSSYVRGNCEFISEQSEEERYMWRFVVDVEIPNYFLDMIDSWKKYESERNENRDNRLSINFDEICFIKDEIIYYPFKDRNE